MSDCYSSCTHIHTHTYTHTHAHTHNTHTHRENVQQLQSRLDALEGRASLAEGEVKSQQALLLERANQIASLQREVDQRNLQMSTLEDTIRKEKVRRGMGWG